MSARSLAIPSAAADRNWDSLQFRFIFAISFVFHLVAATSARLTPAHYAGGSARRSILGDAIEAAGTTAQIAFYG